MGTLLAIEHQITSAPAVSLPAIDAAFRALYALEYAPMVRLARGMVDTRERAEEVVQDAFAKVLDRWDRLDNPGGYLRTCVVNGARSELRKREVRRRLGRESASQSEVASATEPEYLMDALATLAPKRRVALVLRFYGDHSEKEIAEMMNVRPGTVKSLVSRGLDDLRKVIEQ